jgi:hypothetical protein
MRQEGALYRLLRTQSNGEFGRLCKRARLQSGRKWLKIEAGFTDCGKTRSFTNLKGFVKGHDFSRADKAYQINVGLQPLQNSGSSFALKDSFFRH